MCCIYTLKCTKCSEIIQKTFNRCTNFDKTLIMCIDLSKILIQSYNNSISSATNTLTLHTPDQVGVILESIVFSKTIEIDCTYIPFDKMAKPYDPLEVKRIYDYTLKKATMYVSRKMNKLALDIGEQDSFIDDTTVLTPLDSISQVSTNYSDKSKNSRRSSNSYAKSFRWTQEMQTPDIKELNNISMTTNSKSKLITNVSKNSTRVSNKPRRSSNSTVRGKQVAVKY